MSNEEVNNEEEELELELESEFESEGKKPQRPHKYQSLRHSVRYFYDLQRLRIQAGNRNAKRKDDTGADLSELDKAFLVKTSEGLHQLEKDGLKEVKRLLKGIPIYESWLLEQKGCGPTMSGVIVAELEKSERYDTISKLWAFCGLAVDTSTGKARRRKKGEKANWNNFLKTKLVGVLGPCMIKANSPWRSHYDNYKHRKQSQMGPCMLCGGKGKTIVKEGDNKGKLRNCTTCSGTGGPVPWGNSDAHRHNAAMRYMVKCFLLELWTTWRTLDGLPVTPPYSEAKLGIKHGDHSAVAHL